MLGEGWGRPDLLFLVIITLRMACCWSLLSLLILLHLKPVGMKGSLSLGNWRFQDRNDGLVIVSSVGKTGWSHQNANELIL